MTLGFKPVWNKLSGLNIITPCEARAWQRVVFACSTDASAHALMALENDLDQTAVVNYVVANNPGITNALAASIVGNVFNILNSLTLNEEELQVITVD